jgi:hypothetical protein
MKSHDSSQCDVFGRESHGIAGERNDYCIPANEHKISDRLDGQQRGGAAMMPPRYASYAIKYRLAQLDVFAQGQEELRIALGLR